MENGHTEYDSELPLTFPATAMDLEGTGVFRGGGAMHEYIADIEVARDPVARLFARVLGLEAGQPVVARRGREVRLDAGNRAVLRQQGAMKARMARAEKLAKARNLV